MLDILHEALTLVFDILRIAFLDSYPLVVI